MHAIAVSLSATGILQRDKFHAGKFSPLQRKCINIALCMATLGPQGRPSKLGLQVFHGQCQYLAHDEGQPILSHLFGRGLGYAGDWPCLEKRDFAGLGLSWRGFAEEGGLGGLRWGATAWGLGQAEMVFILSPPPACKESFILNPFPLLTPPEIVLCCNGLILKRDK